MTEHESGVRESGVAAGVSAGADRAAQERQRRRRRTTPLLASLETAPPARSGDKPRSVEKSRPAGKPRPVDQGTTHESGRAVAHPRATAPRRAHDPAPVAEVAPAAEVVSSSPARTPAAEGVSPVGVDQERTSVTGQAPATPGRLPRRAPLRPAVVPQDAHAPAASRRAKGRRLVAVKDLDTSAHEAAQEAAASVPTGSSPSLERLADILEFIRHRLSGDYAVDDFGFDPEFTDTVFLAALRVLYTRWFRVSVSGADNLPTTGGALLVANHAGTVALDALMLQVAVHDETPGHRHLRSLGADLVFNTPGLAEVARRTGATLASNPDAERLLQSGELVAVFPEGFKGVGKPFTERYKLQRFGRGGFVSAALHCGVPIIPVAIVGSDETYPLIGDVPARARLLGVPYVPITPLFPLLGPLGLVPLPSKWLIEFGAPLNTDALGPGAAEDPMLVFDLTDQVRQTIQQNLYQLLVRRRTAFF